MALIQKRCNRDVGNIVTADEGFGDFIRRQEDGPAHNAIGEKTFTEVLEEPAGPDDRPAGAGGLKRALGGFRLVFAATRQKDQPLDTRANRKRGKPADRINRTRHRQIRLEADIDAIDIFKDGRPGRLVGPVEGRRRGARADAHRDAPLLKAGRDPPPRLAGTAQN